MKKGLIILIMLFLLTGCKTKENEIEPNERAITLDLNVCNKDCDTNEETFLTDYYPGYLDFLDTLELSLAPNSKSEDIAIINGELIDRDDIVTVDPVSDNYKIPVMAPYGMFQRSFFVMRELIRYCEPNEECDVSFLPGFTALTSKYGFNENEGYYSFITKEDQNEKRVEYFSYEITSEMLNYEYFVYFSEQDLYHYYSLLDGIYYEYKLYGDNKTYTKINSETNDFIYYSSSESDTMLIFHDPLDGIVFEYRETSGGINYDVSEYEAFVLKSSLSLDEDLLELTVNFNEVSAWDKAQTLHEHFGYNTYVLTDSNVPKYEEYEITLRSQGSRYLSVIGTIELEEDDIDSFEFPQTYNGEMTLRNLYDYILELKNVEEPYDMTGSNLSTLNANMEIVTTYIDEYIKSME